MDQAAKQKQQKSRREGEAAGWMFQPVVADTYGVLRANARGFASRFIHRYHNKFFFPLAGHAIWSTISSAIVGHAAQQICRLALTDTPLGLPNRALDLRTAPSTSSTLPVREVLNILCDSRGIKCFVLKSLKHNRDEAAKNNKRKDLRKQ